MYKGIDHIFSFGDQWIIKMQAKVHNKFWKDVLSDWNVIISTQKLKNENQIIRSSLWYNSDVSKHSIFFQDWYNKGIHIIADIANNDNRILGFNDLNSKFNMRSNILNYYTIKTKVDIFLSKYKDIPNPLVERPMFPSHLDILFKAKKGCRKFYEIYTNSSPLSVTPRSEVIWADIVSHEDVNLTVAEKWKTIYKICFNSVIDNNSIWFQYRIINKILGTKEYLTKLKIKTDSTCSFCAQYGEDIEHLFFKCQEVMELWNNIQQWLSNKIGENIILTDLMKLMGYVKKDNKFWPLNLILLCTRNYIFWASRKGYKLNIYLLQKEIKKVYLEQETLSLMNSQNDG